MAALTHKQGGLILAAMLVFGFFSGAGRGILTTPADRPIGPIQGPGIALLGTSLSHHETWLEEAAQGVIACGIPTGTLGRLTHITQPGAHSGWGLSQIDQVLMARPGLVLVEFGINDADIRDGLWPEQSRENLHAIITKIHRTLPQTKITLLTMNPVTGIARFSRPFQARYNRIIREVAGVAQIGLVDLAPRWRIAFDSGMHLPDGRHPEAKDTSRILVPALITALAKAYGQPDCPPD